jgi:hypothetical protein
MPNWLTETLKAIGIADIRNFVLIFDGFLILGLLYIIVFREIPEVNNKIIYMGLGIVLGVYAAGRNYLFGQSKSENDKNKTT